MQNSLCRSVMIVDDSPEIRETFQSLLEMEGYPVITASNGKEAFDLLTNKADEVAAIFLDLNMPVMDGREFLKRKNKCLKGSFPPVIVFAAAARQEKLEGIVEYIKKPVDIDYLLDVVQKYCEI